MRLLLPLFLFAVAVLLVPAASAGDGIQLVPGTAVLLSNPNGGGGNGGNTSSTTSATTIFSPASYVDYKRAGGEPTVAVDRYAGGHDEAYACAPVGVPTFSHFWRSFNLGQTWRVPPHDPVFGKSPTSGVGSGGDCYLTVGSVTHNIFFSDLPLGCLTMNRSIDHGATFTEDPVACGLSPDAIDDREWHDADETASTQNVYMSFIHATSTSINLVRSEQDGAPGTFAIPTQNPCNFVTDLNGPQPDSTPTPCPDPMDVPLVRSGPIVVDKSPTSTFQHNLYIPFIRSRTGGFDAPFSLKLAKSTDQGRSWTRYTIADLGPHNPSYDFPSLTIDTAGNLYVGWVQDQSDNGGETDAYYAFSTDGGLTWSKPINITGESNDSAIFPWLVAGDPGQVDYVFYKSNSGLNPNVDGGQVWNVYFSQSQNALNTGANFKSVQISDHPNHVGAICNSGLGCPANSRNLLDFFTVDVDHLGAANVIWADDNNSRHDAFNKFSRQISGNSVFKSTPIGLTNLWPVIDHKVTDPPGDVQNADGLPTATACPSMDILAESDKQNGDLVTVNLTLGAPPSAAQALLCAGAAGNGGLCGAEWWSSSNPDPTTGGGPNDNFYIAFVDNPLDTAAPTPHVEAGRLNSLSATLSANEFHRVELGTGGTCVANPQPNFPNACTISMTASLTGLGIKSGAGMYSITPLSVYWIGNQNRPPGLRVPLGDTEEADVGAPYDDNGTGTTK